MPTCNDLRLGGTLSGSGITGGVSINGTAYSVTDWSSILGLSGVSNSQVEVYGSPGAIAAGDLLGLPYFFDLNLAILDRNFAGGLTEATANEQKQANTDLFLSLLAAAQPQYLELDMPDGSSRFRRVQAFNPAPIRQPRRLRTISAPMTDNWPYWHEGGNESTDTISGADTLIVGGDVDVYDAVLVFSGDGTFTHTGLGWGIEVTGSGGAVTVTLGPPPRTVTEGGNPAPNRVRLHPAPNQGRKWGWFEPGNNAVTSDVSVTVTWRDQYA